MTKILLKVVFTRRQGNTLFLDAYRINPLAKSCVTNKEATASSL